MSLLSNAKPRRFWLLSLIAFAMIALFLVRANANTIAIGKSVTLNTRFRVMDTDLKTGLGLQDPGMGGVVIGGPVKIGKATWWRVDFGTGVDGWVNGSVLAVSGSITVTMTAAPSSVAAGGASALTWSAPGATSCNASGASDFSGAKAASGSATVFPTGTTTYTIMCTGSSGSGSASTTVAVAGAAFSVSLSANPTAIPVGGTSTLNWSAPGATACTASGGSGFAGTVAASGSLVVQPAQTTSFSLTCAGPGGSQSASSTLQVGNAQAGAASAFADPDHGAIPDRAKHPLAFPTAIGFGKNTSVRSPNAVVYKINSLEDTAVPGDGKITYRECALALPVTSPYSIPAGRPRYCVFDVAGAISIQSPAYITNPKIYIAGQTSPGGIEFRLGDKYDPVDSLIDTRKGGNDFILRHVRTRTGPHVGRTSQNGDPIRMSTGVSNQIIDHVSTMFGTDESLDMSCSNCTVQWSIIGPNICRNAGHTSNLHCKTFFLKPAGNITIAHNLSQHGEQRGINIAVGIHPIVAGTAMQADIFNNVLYHFIAEQGLVSNQFGSVYANYMNNVSLRGPRYNGSEGNFLVGLYGLATPQHPYGFNIHARGNVTPHTRVAGQFGQTVNDPNNHVAGFIQHVTPAMVCGLNSVGTRDCSRQGMAVVQDSAFALPPGKVSTMFENWQITSAEQAMRGVLAYAGADLCRDGPCRDNVDAMYIEDVRTCDTAPQLFASNWPGSVAEAGGWANLTQAQAKIDTDNDGMPDEWERRFRNTNPNVWDANDDKDGDGYPNIEEYLNYLAQDHLRYSGFIGSATGALPAYNCGRAMYPRA